MMGRMEGFINVVCFVVLYFCFYFYGSFFCDGYGSGEVVCGCGLGFYFFVYIYSVSVVGVIL